MKCARYWKFLDLTDAQCVEEASKHKTRNDWKRRANGLYQHVHKHRPHLLEACTAHMVSEGNPFGTGYQVYTYEFADNSVYVGLTCTPKRRHRDHLKRGPVQAKITANIAYEFFELAGGLVPTVAGAFERISIEHYQECGWQVLNTAKGGSTGQIRTLYTYEKLLDLARPYSTRKQFDVGQSGAYQYACKHKLIDRLASELGWPEHAGHVWTKEMCLESARKFKWISDWSSADWDAYQAAMRNGWLNAIKMSLFTKHKPVQIFWTREACLKRAKAFSSRAKWQYGCGDGSYVSARRRGWLIEVASTVFGKRLNRWSSVVKV